MLAALRSLFETQTLEEFFFEFGEMADDDDDDFAAFFADPIAIEFVAQPLIEAVLADIDDADDADATDESAFASLFAEDDVAAFARSSEDEPEADDDSEGFSAFPDDALYVADAIDACAPDELAEDEDEDRSFFHGTIDEALPPSIEYLPVFADLDDHDDGEREARAEEETHSGWSEPGPIDEAPPPVDSEIVIRSRRRRSR